MDRCLEEAEDCTLLSDTPLLFSLSACFLSTRPHSACQWVCVCACVCVCVCVPARCGVSEAELRVWLECECFSATEGEGERSNLGVCVCVCECDSQPVTGTDKQLTVQSGSLSVSLCVLTMRKRVSEPGDVSFTTEEEICLFFFSSPCCCCGRREGWPARFRCITAASV